MKTATGALYLTVTIPVRDVYWIYKHYKSVGLGDDTLSGLLRSALRKHAHMLCAQHPEWDTTPTLRGMVGALSEIIPENQRTRESLAAAIAAEERREIEKDRLFNQAAKILDPFGDEEESPKELPGLAELDIREETDGGTE